MSDERTFTVDLAVNGVDEATEKFDRLRVAIERTAEAFATLADQSHGGFELKMVGNLIHIEVKPATKAA